MATTWTKAQRARAAREGAVLVSVAWDGRPGKAGGMVDAQHVVTPEQAKIVTDALNALHALLYPKK